MTVDPLNDIFGPGTSPATATRIASVKEILSRPASCNPAKDPLFQSVVATVDGMVEGTTTLGHITYHTDVIQGSDEWLAMRRGILTASEMKHIITPSLKIASNDKERAHVYRIAAQRITEYVEPCYIGDDMLRGQDEEVDARLAYITNYAPVREVGFITNDRFGFTLGFSPDGCVGNSGGIECKSKRQDLQLKTIIECAPANAAPDEHMIQIQTGLLVSEWEWIDFISYCGGMPMMTIRVFPDPKIQAAIIEAATAFEKRVQAVIAKYHEIMQSGARMVPTERRVEQEITL